MSDYDDYDSKDRRPRRDRAKYSDDNFGAADPRKATARDNRPKYKDPPTDDGYSDKPRTRRPRDDIPGGGEADKFSPLSPVTTKERDRGYPDDSRGPDRDDRRAVPSSKTMPRQRDYDNMSDGESPGARPRLPKQSSRRQPDPEYDDDPRGPPQRSYTDRDADRYDKAPRSKREPDPYDEPAPRRRGEDRDYRREDDYPPPRSRKYDDDDKPDDRGYRSEGREARRRPAYDEKYESHGDRGPTRRDDGARRRDEGYASDRGYRDRDRDRERDRYGDRDREKDRYGGDRDRERDRDRRRDRDRDRDRDYRDRDRDRDRGGSSRKKGAGAGGFAFDTKDIPKYVEAGQKHYKSVKPLVDQLAKMYFDNKKV